MESTGLGSADRSARGETEAPADLRSRLANVLRAQGDDSLADALDHGLVEVKGQQIEIRSLPDYRAVLEMSMAILHEAARSILASNARVTLGSDLAAAEPGPAAAPNTASAETPRPVAGSSGSAPRPSDAVQRALADPEVQRIQKLFAGQIREVRNLRGYTP
jgi:hypothetical protein